MRGWLIFFVKPDIIPNYTIPVSKKTSSDNHCFRQKRKNPGAQTTVPKNMFVRRPNQRFPNSWQTCKFSINRPQHPTPKLYDGQPTFQKCEWFQTMRSIAKRADWTNQHNICTCKRENGSGLNLHTPGRPQFGAQETWNKYVPHELELSVQCWRWRSAVITKNNKFPQKRHPTNFVSHTSCQWPTFLCVQHLSICGTYAESFQQKSLALVRSNVVSFVAPILSKTIVQHLRKLPLWCQTNEIVLPAFSPLPSMREKIVEMNNVYSFRSPVRGDDHGPFMTWAKDANYKENCPRQYCAY